MARRLPSSSRRKGKIMCSDSSILEKEATSFALVTGSDLEATRLAWETCTLFIRTRLDKFEETRVAIALIDALTEVDSVKDNPPG